MTPANEAAFLVAFAYIAAVLGVLLLAAHLAGFLARVTRGWFGDDAEHDPHAELHCLDDPDSWPDDPRFRADIARTRTARTRHRMTREAWERATGKDIA